MGIKWNMVFRNERRQFERMTETERFVYFLLLQYGSPYGWGKENPESSDCSGVVCMALYAATGLLVRTTADDLYHRVFTVKNPGRDMIRAAFFFEGINRKAIHVAALVDNEAVLNSQEGGARVRSLEELRMWFGQRGNGMAVRGLDRGALERMAGEGKARYELDTEFGKYFDMGASDGRGEN